MKITEADYELAERFPHVPTDFYGHGVTPAKAKVSPDQTTRLLLLKLIELSPKSASHGGYAGSDGKEKPGSGVMGRRHTCFIRTFDKRPK